METKETSTYSLGLLQGILPRHEIVLKKTLAESLLQAKISRIPSPIAAYDFRIDPGEDPTEKIAAIIRDLRPDKPVAEVGIAMAPKTRGGPVHCFVEFYLEPLEEAEEVITDEMRLRGQY